MLRYQAEAMSAEVTFGRQLNGYNKEQVDNYIDMLTESYQAAYENYNAMSGKYLSLQKTCEQLEKQSKQEASNAEVITKTLLDAETMAQNIIAEAKTLAEKIKVKAVIEAGKIRGDACIEKLAAKRSIEAADESLVQTITKLQALRIP